MVIIPSTGVGKKPWYPNNMPKLIISLGNSLLNEYPLTKENTTVGRNSENDIVLDNPASGHHARIIQSANQYTIEDLGSTNGTLVNRQKITQPQKLTAGDVITIGKHELRFESDNAQSVILEKTVFVRMTNNPGNSAAASNSPATKVKQPTKDNTGIIVIAGVVIGLIILIAAYLWWKMAN